MSHKLLREMKVDRLTAKDRWLAAQARMRLAGQKRRELERTQEEFFEDLEADPETVIKAEDAAAQAEKEFHEAHAAECDARRKFRRAELNLKLLLTDLRTGQSRLPLIERAPGELKGEEATLPEVQVEDDAQAEEEPPPPFETMNWSPEVLNHELTDFVKRYGLVEHYRKFAFTTLPELRERLVKTLPFCGRTPPDVSHGLYGYRFVNYEWSGLKFWIGADSPALVDATLRGDELVLACHQVIFGREPLELPPPPPAPSPAIAATVPPPRRRRREPQPV